MRRRARWLTFLAVLGLLGTIAAPLPGAAAAPPGTTVSPLTGGKGVPVGLTTSFDLAQVGYERSEVLLSGTASAYSPTAPLTSDGRWSVAPSSQAPFTTRLIVHRPSTRTGSTAPCSWSG